MNIRKINEQLETFIINELTDETRQRAANERKARYLAAQATADREKARYEQTQKRANALKPKTEEQVIDSLETFVREELDFISKSFSDVKESNGDFYVVITVEEELNESAEEQLKKLLEKMTELYGCKYTYEVKGTQVKIICEKPNIVDLEKEKERVYNICKNMVGKELEPIINMEWDYESMGSGAYLYTDFSGDNVYIYINDSRFGFTDKDGKDHEDADVCIGYCADGYEVEDDNYRHVWIQPGTSESKIKEIFKKVYEQYEKSLSVKEKDTKLARKLEDNLKEFNYKETENGYIDFQEIIFDEDPIYASIVYHMDDEFFYEGLGDVHKHRFDNNSYTISSKMEHKILDLIYTVSNVQETSKLSIDYNLDNIINECNTPCVLIQVYKPLTDKEKQDLIEFCDDWAQKGRDLIIKHKDELLALNESKEDSHNSVKKINEKLDQLLERSLFHKFLYSKKDMETDVRNFLRNNLGDIGCCDYELGEDANGYVLVLTCVPEGDTFRVVLINAELEQPCLDENGYIVDMTIEQRDIDNDFRVMAREIVRRIEDLV